MIYDKKLNIIELEKQDGSKKKNQVDIEEISWWEDWYSLLPISVLR